MDDRTLYATLLGLTSPWKVEKVELKLKEGEVHVWVGLPPEQLWVCPECHERAPIHDYRGRVWRHLDTFQYKTLLHARIPRLNCPNHGIRQLQVPWAEDRSRFTALFEAVTIDWLKQAPIAAVATRMRLSWNEVAGIQERAVQRGLARREKEVVRIVGVDEKAFRKRHNYVTVVSDLERSRVLYLADDRVRGSLDEFWKSCTPAWIQSVEAVVSDMWDAYIGSVYRYVPDADEKVVVDKFHVAKLLNDAVDQVRRQENHELLRRGCRRLVGSKFWWLRNPESFTDAEWDDFAMLRKSKLRTARAWAIKETAMDLYACPTVHEADRRFEKWYRWAMRARLEPMRRVAGTLRRYWMYIRAWYKHRITNAGSEGLNSLIQRVKVMSRGFRNVERFKNAIYFHLGGLDLYPDRLHSTQ
jgi:transposase